MTSKTALDLARAQRALDLWQTRYDEQAWVCASEALRCAARARSVEAGLRLALIALAAEKAR